MDQDQHGASGASGASGAPNARPEAPPSPAALRRAVVVAGHRRDAQTARSHLSHEDPAVRCAALGALLRAGGLCPDDLLETARDHDATVRRRVAEIAAHLGAGSTTEPAPGTTDRTRALEEVLFGLLGDHDDMVSEMAAFALGELPLGDTEAALPRRVVSLAEVATGHRDPLCREAAVAALGAIGHPAGLVAVLSACEDRANVRRRAVLALAAFEGYAVTTMLERLSEDRDLQVSQAAVDLLEIESGHRT